MLKWPKSTKILNATSGVLGRAVECAAAHVFVSETVPATKDSGAASGSMLYYLGTLLKSCPCPSAHARIAACFVVLAGLGIGLQYG
jgi:hypothetical protein